MVYYLLLNFMIPYFRRRKKWSPKLFARLWHNFSLDMGEARVLTSIASPFPLTVT